MLSVHFGDGLRERYFLRHYNLTSKELHNIIILWIFRLLLEKIDVDFVDFLFFFFFIGDFLIKLQEYALFIDFCSD